jgi:2-polyprenyl-3-methyl-5-hydroxy-6-metoxy-1,4-benzoquinol methylase/polysaccharide pyruvyl transferase WcaK-like protein
MISANYVDTTYKCPLCSSTNHDLLHNKGRHNKEVFNYICSGCGFIFILPRPSHQKLESLYQENAFSKDERRLSSPDDQKFKQCEHIARSRIEILARTLADYLPLNSTQKSVLDVGCGTGSFLRFMKAYGWKVLGLEPDAVYTKAAKERYNIEIQNEFVEKIDSNQKFDLITSFHVIEHVDSPSSFLNSIHELLNNDGYIFIECPSIDHWYGDTIDFFFWDVHINTFTQKTLLAFLAKAGFQLIESGWNGIGLWVIAKKVEPGSLPVIWDNPDRIGRIVQEAVTGSERSSHQMSKLNRFVSLKKDPLQIPSRILKRVHRHLGRHLGIRTNPLDAQNIALKPSKAQAVSLKIAHVGLHGNGNAGDTLLFPAVRWLFQKKVSPTHFTLIPLRKPVTQETIAQINQQDALVIGGGGLFLADSNPNEHSGWQWACPLELLEQIKVPIILFAVGYNRFRGQKNFAPIFEKNVQLLIEKSAFVGIRNRGSIEALKNYLPESLHEKIHYQPCPTTMLRHFYPDLPQHTEASKPTLAVNIAFDRHHLRFGKREDEILWSMADAFLELERQGWQIKLFNHGSIDGDARFWFRARGLFAEEVNIGGVPPVDILREYSQATIAVGMRGHAQMIPFGLHRPIYSLISHDKLQFFLDDIGHSDWGVEVQAPNLSEKLIGDLNGIYTNLPQIETQLKTAQSELWKITLQNLNLIKKSLNV